MTLALTNPRIGHSETCAGQIYLRRRFYPPLKRHARWSRHVYFTWVTCQDSVSIRNLLLSLVYSCVCRRVFLTFCAHRPRAAAFASSQGRPKPLIHSRRVCVNRVCGLRELEGIIELTVVFDLPARSFLCHCTVKGLWGSRVTGF